MSGQVPPDQSISAPTSAAGRSCGPRAYALRVVGQTLFDIE